MQYSLHNEWYWDLISKVREERVSGIAILDKWASLSRHLRKVFPARSVARVTTWAREVGESRGNARKVNVTGRNARELEEAVHLRIVWIPSQHLVGSYGNVWAQTVAQSDLGLNRSLWLLCEQWKAQGSERPQGSSTTLLLQSMGETWHSTRMRC